MEDIKKMKKEMKTLCLIALLIACSMAVTMKRPMTNA